MRNLKKILALVLALVMSFSLMATANAFTDSDKINGTYEEAVEVLSALKVFQGYENGSFVPQGSITRAEVAAIIYRIVTGDVTNKQVGIYADYNKFDDVKSTSWYAGYVNFCANAEYIKGYDAKTFGPNDPVTGYQALAMILRAVGYDKNGEFTGAGWQTQTAAVGKKLGITDNVSEGTLGVAATREVVAEILFRSILVPQVEYTVAFGYQSIGQVSIGYETFKLVGSVSADDEWGRPSKVWKLDKDNDKVAETTDTTLVSLAIDPVASYTAAVTECQVAQDVGFTGTKTYTVYTNGIANKTSDTLYANNTVNTIGAQGRLTLVYTDRIVYIDTLLAEVTAVRNAVLDAAGHVVTPATITLKVYDANNAFTVVTLANGGTNYTYTVGNMLLVYAVQNGQGKVVTNTNIASMVQQHVEILGVAESFVGAQSTIWANIKKHVIGGTEYTDNNRFHLDQAGRDLTNHTWYKDQNGNLIGATDVISTNYGVLKNIRWIVGAPGHVEATMVDMTGNESTVTVATIDGVVPNSGFALTNDDAKVAYRAHAQGAIVGKVAYVSDELLYNNLYEGYAMYRVDTNLDGSVNLEGAENGVAIVTYLKDANFNANASAIMKSADVGGGIATYVSSNTQYLVKGANNTYTAITGTQAMTSYAKADIFYVDTNKDSIADYVYIRTGELAGASEALIYVTTTAYTWGLTDGKYVWSMVANVNGEADKTIYSLDQSVMTALSANTSLNTLFKATLDPATGYVKSVQQITTSGGVVTVNGMKVDYIAVPKVIDGYTLVGAGAGESYRVDNAAVVGTKTDLASINTYTDGIWVVYTNNVYNTASTVYVGQKVANTQGQNDVILANAKNVLEPNGTAVAYDPINLVDGTNAMLEAAVKAAINSKLAAAGVYLPAGSTITFGVAPTVPGTSGETVWFQYTLTVGTGATAASYTFNGNKVVVNNTVSSTAVQKAIVDALEASKALTAGMTPQEYTAALSPVVTGARAGFTVSNITVSGDLQTGNNVTVTVTGTDATFGAMTITARMTVQA